MINETDFYNVLMRIARSLENINVNLGKIENSRNKESTQFVKESKQRVNDIKRRKILNEMKNTERFKRELYEQIRDPDKAVKNILEDKKNK